MMHLLGLTSASLRMVRSKLLATGQLSPTVGFSFLLVGSLCLFAAVAPNAVAQEPIQHESLPARLSEIEVSQDGCWIIAAGADEGSICMIEIAQERCGESRLRERVLPR